MDNFFSIAEHTRYKILNSSFPWTKNGTSEQSNNRRPLGRLGFFICFKQWWAESFTSRYWTCKKLIPFYISYVYLFISFFLQLHLLVEGFSLHLSSFYQVIHNYVNWLLQVQNLIERCLQLYMNRDEVVKTLLTRARIDPGFTTLGMLPDY